MLATSMCYYWLKMVNEQSRGLDKSDRRQVANQLMNLAHIALGSLLFVQALSGRPFSFPAALMAVLIFAVAYYTAIKLMKGGDSQ